MPPGEIHTEIVQRQLDRVLASPGFARNDRMSRFLRFIVERHLAGRESELKESLLGIEVFGRKPGFDPQQDSTVRSEAARLRARLGEYYSGEGKDDDLVIELPKGGYTPGFRQIAVKPEVTIPDQVSNARAPGTPLRILAALCGFSVAVGAGAWRWSQHQNAPISIAVLPFTNLNQDPANDYLADGLTDEIIRNLSIIEGLAVRSRTSSFTFKGKPPNVREAGKQLQAEYILEGSVLRSGRQLRMNAQLIRVRDDFPLRSVKFDRELTDLFAIQDEIARNIVNSLRLELGQGRRRYETSTEAYDFYLRARALEPGDDRAIHEFEQAIVRDPSFAPAYAGLAAAHAFRSGLFRLDPANEAPKMRLAAERALLLDPLLPEAHAALAIAYARDAQWARSEESFRRAIELAPSSSEFRRDFAIFFLWPVGRTEDALKELALAERADPLSSRIHQSLAYMLPSAGRYEEAARHGEKIQADSPARSGSLGRARFWQGRTAEAIQILERALRGGVPAGSEVRGFLGYAYARTGRRDEAEKLAIGTNPFNQAVIFAGLGDRERAVEAMKRSTAAGPFRVGRQLTWPELELIRGDSRMKDLRKKVGLPN